MIQSKSDLRYYLKADAISLGLWGRNPFFTRHIIWRFQRLLRKVEYLENTGKAWSVFGVIPYLITRARISRLRYKLGYTIPPNVFGPGLSIAHKGTIVINAGTRIGANCRINVCVNIGNKRNESQRAPRIGDNVFIGPGAMIFGDIEIADGIAIGANAVVNRSFLEPNITIAGVPARKVSNKGSRGLVIRATEEIEKKQI